MRFAVAAMVLCLLAGSTASAAAAGDAAEKAPRASLEKKVKKLQRQLKKLKGQINEVAQQQGPQGSAGPAGPAGPTGPQGSAGPPTGAAGGDLTGNYPNPTIAPGAIGQDTDTATDCVANGNCSAKIASSSIGFTEIAANQVRRSEIADGSVRAAELGPVVTREDSGSFGDPGAVAMCMPGEIVLGGSGLADRTGMYPDNALLGSWPVPGGWQAADTEGDAFGTAVTAYVRCLQP